MGYLGLIYHFLVIFRYYFFQVQSQNPTDKGEPFFSILSWYGVEHSNFLSPLSCKQEQPRVLDSVEGGDNIFDHNNDIILLMKITSFSEDRLAARDRCLISI